VAQVIDASVAVAWGVPSQATRLTEAVLDAVGMNGGHVPAVFWFEVLYGLGGLEHRGVISRETVDQFLARAIGFPLRIHPARDSAKMTDLHRMARRYRLNVYDAAYLELALELNLPLATRDASLARAAEQAGVKLFTA
jgi:predicted nucleic acid-binding protein